MADSASGSNNKYEKLGLKHITSSLFGIPGFLVESKASSESDSARSPTSPLDFRVFTNLSNPFSTRSSTVSSQNGRQKKWDCSKVGLCIVNLLVDETGTNENDADLLKRKNIIFAPQVKTKNSNYSRFYEDSLDSSVNSNYLRRNYMISSPSKSQCPSPKLGDVNLSFENEEIRKPEPFDVNASSLVDSVRLSSSLNTSTKRPHSSYKKLCSARTAITSSPLVIGGGSQFDNSLAIQPSSLPVAIVSGTGYVGSLSARGIELSEDYTCIISHGPNAKTTHIFGDCILECHTNELVNFDKKEEQEIGSPEMAKPLWDSTSSAPDMLLRFCYSCKKKLENRGDVYTYRDEKAFCSFHCHADEIFVEEEPEDNCNNSSKSSTVSSYQEDLFLMAMPFTS
ncbi:uncharacterized protein LOC110812397 isoform X2 [Carica papaya]|nr:uncharacterized protein LOC110812397 isoform X2 [Carica papaya]XP_021894877.1 uncharacterized protein LOC110812397 isoform X2 [Carica papaya]XP_021894884.1 uncharacterized protein LOC110812397 isoform X2 [Carica papaya]